MKYSLVAAAGLLGVATASYHDHAIFHKRHNNATDQCSTVWSTWYGEPTMVPLAPPPKPTTTSKTTTSTPPPAPKTTSTTTTSSAAASSSPPTIHKAPIAALQKTPPPSNSAGDDFFGHPTGSSGMNGITYSPYEGSNQASSTCKSSGQIQSDIQQIHARGFNRVRIYATDCNQLAAVGAATSQLGMRMIAGIFPNSPGSAQADFAKQLQDLKDYISSNGAGNIDAILVGNEPFSGGHATPSQIASFLQQTKSAFPNIKVSCALTHPELMANAGSLCPLMDVVAAQIHPFFSSSYVAPSNAGEYVESEMGLMSGLCGGKPVFVSETGYPNNGGSWLAQIAGAFEQQSAIHSLKRSSSSNHMTMFSSSTDTWKLASGVQEYEAAFNCLDLF